MADLEITVLCIDKTEGILDRILEMNGPNLVVSAGHPDLDPPGPSLPDFLIFERLATFVQDGAYPEIQVVVETLGSLITNRDIAIHPVPGTRETESNGLADVNPAAGQDTNVSVELFDLERSGLARDR
jgi:hypothetical protein